MTLDISTRRVKDEMSDVVISVGPDDNVSDALGLMMDYRVTVLPVVDGKNRCVGIFSTTDLIAPASEQEDTSEQRREDPRPIAIDTLTDQRLGQQKVRELMTDSVDMVQRETPLLSAAGEMLRHRVHHLPVVDDNQQLLGIVSTMDLLAAFSKALNSK